MTLRWKIRCTPLCSEFAPLDWSDLPPDESTILRFGHLLEKHELDDEMLALINDLLREKGLMFEAGSQINATLIAVPSLSKSVSGERDPEIHPTRIGNQWYLSVKAPIGADAESGLTHTVKGSAGNALLHGQERDAFGDAGCRGAYKQPDAARGVR